MSSTKRGIGEVVKWRDGEKVERWNGERVKRWKGGKVKHLSQESSLPAKIITSYKFIWQWGRVTIKWKGEKVKHGIEFVKKDAELQRTPATHFKVCNENFLLVSPFHSFTLSPFHSFHLSTFLRRNSVLRLQTLNSKAISRWEFLLLWELLNDELQENLNPKEVLHNTWIHR